MNREYKKAIVVLTLIISLPVIFFSLYEYSSISREEKLLAEVYDTQLNSIIFSVNLYTEDIISSWRGKISAFTKFTKDEKALKEFLVENPAVKLIFSKNLETNATTILFNGTKQTGQSDATEIDSLLKSNESKISKLFNYLEAGYRKAEPVTDSLHPGLTQILYASNEQQGKILSGIGIDSKEFIEKTLKPRFQVIARENLVISIFKQATNEKVFSNFPEENGELRKGKMLWLLPGYEMAVKPRSTTVTEIAQKRKSENLIFAGVLALLLLGGAVFLLKNIRKEIKLSEIKSEFVSNVSHELRTPLALINMFAETLSLGRVKTEEKKQEYYEIIGRETERLSAIVNKILNFSQMELGKRTYNFEETDLNEVVSKIYDSYKFHLVNKGFNFNFNKDGALPLLSADHGAISEAVINLIDNGVKYSKEKKDLTIETGMQGEFVFVSVADKGIGIPQEHKKKIFEKFFRVSSGDVHTTKGTGLGLSIVKEIIEAHGGNVEVQSNPGGGSTFILKFKAKESKHHV